MADEWGEYRLKVVSELERLTGAVTKLEEKLDAMQERMTRQESQWRTISGVLFTAMTVLGAVAAFGQWLFPHK